MLDKNKLVEYSDRDPRYNLTISDSSHYGIAILPLQLKQLCVNGKYTDTKSNNYDDELITPIDEYENNIADISDFVPKKLNTNVFYSDTMISKIDNPDLEIDRSPDINFTDTDFTDTHLTDTHNPNQNHMIYKYDKPMVSKVSDVELNKNIREHFGKTTTIPNNTLILVIVILVIVICLMSLCVSCCM